MAENASSRRLVWDLPLRLFHWLLVLSIAASWYTADQSNKGEFIEIGEKFFGYAQIHFWVGYWTLGLIIFRVIWGFVGPRHARFSSFIKGPSAVLAYLRSTRSPGYVPPVGHNPLGAWSVVVLLAVISAQVFTGLFLVDNTEIYLAPYNPAVEAATASKFKAFHVINFDVLLWLVGLHILAVLFYVVVKKQNLIAAMITGRKPAQVVPGDEAIAGSQLLKALVVIAIAALAVWLVLEMAPPLPEYDDYGDY
jgi:cytochrome b